MKFFVKAMAVVIILAMAVATAWLWRLSSVKKSPVSGGEDVSVKLADRVHFQQRDPRWADDNLGGRNDNSLGGYGCTVASVAMAMTNLGHPTDPGKLNADLTARNGFTEQGWLQWAAIGELTHGAVRVEVHDAPSLEAMDACLSRGAYPIVKFMIGGVAPHWVMLVGKRRGTYFIRDPLLDEAEPVPLSSRNGSRMK
jgi:hypothetical protein